MLGVVGQSSHLCEAVRLLGSLSVTPCPRRVLTLSALRCEMDRQTVVSIPCNICGASQTVRPW